MAKPRRIPPTINDPLARLKQNFNQAWSLVSLQKKTLGDVLDYLGIDPATLPEKYDLSTKPTYDVFFKIKTYILEKELAGLNTVSYWQEPESLLWQPAIRDSLVESSYRHLTRREEIHELVKDILPPRNPKQKANLFYFQQEAAELTIYKLLKLNYSGILLRANTGDGKTYHNGQILRWLIDLQYHEGKSLSPYPYLYVTKASIVEQTKQDLQEEFGLDVPGDVLVLNYDALRASLGEMFIKEEHIVQYGEELIVYSWKEHIHPIVIIWDEYQALKNINSLQATIAAKINSVKGEAAKYLKQISSSATPFSKVISAKCFCLSTRKLIDFGVAKNTPLRESFWTDEANRIAFPDKPTDYSKGAIQRLLKRYDPYIVGFKNVRRKHKAINTEELIDFATKEDAAKYQRAWEDYLEAKAKLEGGSVKNAGLLVLIEFLKFRQAAELIRARELAKRMYDAVQRGKAAVCACNFKPTIAKAVMILHNDYGVGREQISLIWGGDASLSSESKWTKDDIKNILRGAAKGEEIRERDLKEILKQLQMEAAGLGEIPKELELGIQSRTQRWAEIQRFQNGQSLYCFFTFGAGGAGLSLHHKYEHTRPRETYVSPTYNEMELNQALGRAPRLTSLSDTVQRILLYRGTIEVNVLYRVNQKSKCLTEVIAHSEITDDSLVTQIMKLAGADVEEDEDSDLGQEVFEEHEREKE